MKISRRKLLQASSIVGGGVLAGTLVGADFAAGTRTAIKQRTEAEQEPLPVAFKRLRPLGSQVKPILPVEFQTRILKAQQLMTDANPAFDLLFVTPGTTLGYYTGIHWWPSERILALLLPRKGDPVLISAAFEEGRLREQLPWPIEIRVWQEDQSPYAIASGWLSDHGIRTGRVGVEETTQYVFFDGLRRSAPALEYASGDPVTVGCRAQKSAHELELMRLACSATFEVYRAVFASLREGQTQKEVADLVVGGFAQMALPGEALVLFGPSAALPHGTMQEQTLREGMGVLIDGGTVIEGYHSDVTRTSVLGKPSKNLSHAFQIVRQAQNAALDAAVAGRECGSVDDAARKVIVGAGYGPGYKYFTHRLGHGIGLDEHESPYLVRGNKTILKPGMTFSNEPGIYIPGEYGLRCEDDMVIAPSGEARLLTPGFASSLETPIA